MEVAIELGYVPQESFIVPGMIRDNIRFGGKRFGSSSTFRRVFVSRERSYACDDESVQNT